MADEDSSLFHDAFVAGFAGGLGFVLVVGLTLGALTLFGRACGASPLGDGASHSTGVPPGDECDSSEDCSRVETCQHGYCVED